MAKAEQQVEPTEEELAALRDEGHTAHVCRDCGAIVHQGAAGACLECGGAPVKPWQLGVPKGPEPAWMVREREADEAAGIAPL